MTHQGNNGSTLGASSSNPGMSNESSSPKSKLPETFHGQKSKLREFITQCKLYWVFNADKFATDVERTLWAASFLRGKAFDWIEPHLNDAMDNVVPPELVDSNAEDYTRKLFNTWDGFEEGIIQIFGDRD